MTFYSFSKFRTLSLRGNPLCDDSDWTSYVKALLPNLIYLECQAITADEREKATARHQVSFFCVRSVSFRVVNTDSMVARYILFVQIISFFGSQTQWSLRSIILHPLCLDHPFSCDIDPREVLICRPYIGQCHLSSTLFRRNPVV